MAGVRGRSGRATLLRPEGRSGKKTSPDARDPARQLPTRSVVAPARPPRARRDRLRCQGCGTVFPAIDMWIDAKNPARGFCDACYYARQRRERGGEAG